MCMLVSAEAAEGGHLLSLGATFMNSSCILTLPTARLLRKAAGVMVCVVGGGKKRDTSVAVDGRPVFGFNLVSNLQPD